MKKNVVITGAGSGLGASLAQKLSSEGYHVSLLGRTKAKLEQVAKSLKGSYSIYTIDVSSHAQVEEIFTKIYADHENIDILINNAGLGIFHLAEDLRETDINKMIDINLKGTIYCTQQVLPKMKTDNQGSIVNVISTAGIEGKVNESVYCASKFGVKGFTESIQAELQQYDIRVLAAYMGGMKTPFWEGVHKEEDMEHLMDAEDIADIIIGNMAYRNKLNVKEVVIKNK